MKSLVWALLILAVGVWMVFDPSGLLIPEWSTRLLGCAECFLAGMLLDEWPGPEHE